LEEETQRLQRKARPYHKERTQDAALSGEAYLALEQFRAGKV